MDDVHEWVEKLVSSTKDHRHDGKDIEKGKHSNGSKSDKKEDEDWNEDGSEKGDADGLFHLPKIECK